MNYSLIMPVYNGKPYFKQALESAINAIGPEDEIIVIEDGSTDGGVKSIVNCYANNAQIEYFSKSNGGVATALNFGLEKSSNEIFSWLSHDDLYLPNRLESDRLLRANSPNIVTVSNFYLLNDLSGMLTYVDSVKHLHRFQRWRLLSRRFLNGNCLSAPVELLKSNGGFDVNLAYTQDYALWLKLLNHGDFVSIPDATVLSRQHPLQDSVTQSILARKEYISLLKRHVKISDLTNPRNMTDVLRILKSIFLS
jgi:glycosyltransferase involved in cell wall biosynthesis